MSSWKSPVDAFAWPTRLRARVVTPGEAPRMHGYEVESDLARHYRFSETVLLALVGELPDRDRTEAFEVALVFLSATSVAEGPAHAAVLARTCEGESSAVIGTGVIALAEQARVMIARHREFLQWLASSEGAPPPEALASTEPASLVHLREALTARGVSVPALSHPLTRDAALMAVLHFSGLVRAEHLESALVLARLPTVAAEAFAVTPASFREYPLNVPAFRYEEDR